MTRWISLVIVLCCISQTTFSQNIYSEENSRRFATYLFDSGQYDLASEEFERVLFLNPADSTSIKYLLLSYKYAGKYQLGMKRGIKILPEWEALDRTFFKELFSLSLLAGDYKTSAELIEKNAHLETLFQSKYNLSLLMLKKDWSGAESYYNSLNEQDKLVNFGYRSLMDEKASIKKKSPFLSAVMSTVVPGLGKVYTNDWQDGIITFLFVASNAWQAYRGFNKDGIKSTYGWIFASIGGGFYLGNIYGSHKAARKYNRLKEEQFNKHAEAFIYSNL